MPKQFDRRNDDEHELHESAERRQSPSAAVVFEAIRHEGEEELCRHFAQLAWSALAAGLAMGFSFLMEAMLAEKLPPAKWSDVISNFGYSFGFLIVVLGRQQLFTETPVIAVLPLLNARKWIYLLKVLRLWSIVLVANVIGTFIFAWVITDASLFTDTQDAKLRELSLEVFRHDFGTSLLGAVFAGWLVALMVWLLPFAETARVIVIILLTYVIGLAGFPHVIAGSVEGFYAVLVGAAGWHEFLFRFFLPALIGNTIGGVILVAALNYGQVAPGDTQRTNNDRKEERP